ncbi:MAG: dolichyl-phosphate-mannose--protein mannosyltransferase [Bacteroidales bacterium]|nr:dolichyl-phosphate-mannose--protein mannosyltransferase [Bacteroidales bacterium]
MKGRAWIRDYGCYLLWFAALLPLAMLRDFTPSNELRYMSIADEALREGHWFAFYHHGEPYADKPPLYLWLVMLGRWLFGDGCMGFLSLFSILPGLGIVAVMDRWVRGGGEEADGLGLPRRRAGQWMLLTTAFFAGGMVVLRMDMLMSLFIVLALRVFYRIYEGREKAGDRWWFPLLVFMALFTKGPYGVMIPVAGAMAFLLVERCGKTYRRGLWRRCFGWRFWLVLLSLSGLWWGMVYAEGGCDYLHNLLFNQTVHRAVDSFSHKRGFFYYFWSFGHAAAPWSLLYVAVLLTALGARFRRRPASDTAAVAVVGTALPRFFLTVFLTSLLMLSCVSAKLEVYLLPVYPFVVYYVLLRMPRWEGKVWARLLVSVPLLALTSALPAVLCLPSRIPSLSLLQGFQIYIAAAVLTAGGLWGWWLLWRRRDTAGTVRTVGLALFVAVFFGAFRLPALNPYMGYGALARAGRDLAAERMPNAEALVWDDPAVAYGAYRVRRAVGMAAYVKQPVREIQRWDEVQAMTGAGRPLLMFISSGALAAEPAVASACAGRPQRTVGPYTAVWFGTQTEDMETEGGRP